MSLVLACLTLYTSCNRMTGNNWWRTFNVSRAFRRDRDLVLGRSERFVDRGNRDCVLEIADPHDHAVDDGKCQRDPQDKDGSSAWRAANIDTSAQFS